MEDEIVHKRTEEEAKALFEIKEPQYIVLNKKIHKDTKGNESMDLTLFDLNAPDEQKAILSLNAKEYNQTERIAQDHEIEYARKLLKDYRESIWADDLNS